MEFRGGDNNKPSLKVENEGLRTRLVGQRYGEGTGILADTNDIPLCKVVGRAVIQHASSHGQHACCTQPVE